MTESNRMAPDMEDFGADEVAVAPAKATNGRSQRRSKPTPRVRPDSQGPARVRRSDNGPEGRGGGGGIVGFFKDVRLRIALGVCLIVMAVVSLATCISFISANEADQSVVSGRTVSQIVDSGDAVANAGNAVGAKIAHFLMVDTLGVGSMILAVYLVLVGLALIGICRISFWKLTFRSLYSAVAVSVIVGLFTYNQALTFPLGGAHGQYVNKFLLDYTGALGTFAVSVMLLGILVAVFLNYLRAFLGGVRRLVPRRAALGGATAAAAPAAEDVPAAEPTLEDLDHEAPEPSDCGHESNDGVPADDDEPVGAAPTEEIPPADLDVLGRDEGFEIDEPAVDEDGRDLEPEIAEPQQRAELELPRNKEIVVEPAEVPGEPELIINVPAQETVPQAVAEAEPVRHGDHLGLDSTYDPRAAHPNYCFPPSELLMDRDTGVEINEEEQAANKQMIVRALRSYNIEIVRIEATIGPTVTLYEIVPVEGTRISKIKSLEDDIAMTISAIGIRIIAPIPGRGTIGIEVPNRKKQIVPMRKVIESAAFRAQRSRMHLPVALGATISNEIYIEDLTRMPHLLVAGATGQGKSVGLNCLITSLLYSKHPDELKFVLVDPKTVEFKLYNKIAPHFMAKLPDEEQAIITDPQKALGTLNSLCVEMDRRYELISEALVRDVEAYNDKFVARKLNPEHGHRYMPYLVVIVDEFADLITTAGKEIFLPIARIAQKGRAAGLHMVIATQRPSTDVITGMIKANFPARIAFRTLSSIDSKTILDRPGANRLIGRGDMLTFINGATERVQCAFVDTPECEEICAHIASQPGLYTTYELPEVPTEEGPAAEKASVNIHNEEFRECALYISQQTTASITTLQRNFSIGFNKAGRYIDQMEALGIVGPANGSKPRQVLMSPDSVMRLFDTQG